MATEEVLDDPADGRSPAGRPPLVGPFGRRAFRIGRVFGIDVGLDSSWLFIFLLITLSLSQQLATDHESWPAAAVWGGAILASLLFFTSILLHEFGHSLTSQALGLPVKSITLFLFGGLARLTGEPKRPRDMFLIGAAGPAVSVALGLLFMGAGLVMPGSMLWGDVLGAIFGWLGFINLLLAGFNLFPGAPLDGGHLLRAGLWAKTGDLTRATQVAGAMGSLFAAFLIGLGIVTALLAGNLLGGLWLVFIGWFLMTAAKATSAQSVLEDTLGSIRVAEVMNASPPTVQAGESVAAAIEGPVLHQGHRYLIVAEGAEPIGLITLHEIKRVRPEDRSVTPVAEIMVPAEDVVMVAPETSLWEALRTMERANVNQVPVVERKRLLGVLSREQLVRVIKNQMELARG